jgi:transcriptional regulator with XRE-family HTH domain
MLALEGMMNAQRNRGMYLRVGERLAEIRKSRKISQAKLAKLLGVVEGTVPNCEHGRTEPKITRLYLSGQAAPCGIHLPAQSATDSAPAGRANPQAGADMQCRRLSFVGWSLRIAFRSTPASGVARSVRPLPKPRISACLTFNSSKPTVTISAMSAADKPPEQTMDHGYAFKNEPRG